MWHSSGRYICWRQGGFLRMAVLTFGWFGPKNKVALHFGQRWWMACRLLAGQVDLGDGLLLLMPVYIYIMKVRNSFNYISKILLYIYILLFFFLCYLYLYFLFFINIFIHWYIHRLIHSYIHIFIYSYINILILHESRIYNEINYLGLMKLGLIVLMFGEENYVSDVDVPRHTLTAENQMIP